MLKLKKIAKSMEIAISLNSKDSFFNRPLIQAFAIAIGLHLLALGTIQIRSINIFGNQSEIQPVLVDIDMAHIDQSAVLTELAIRDDLPRAIPEPQTSGLRLPTLPPAESSFIAFDYVITPKNIDPLAFNTPPGHPQGTELHISGALAERFIEEPVERSQLPPGPSIRYVYNIQVDNQTGELIWFERLSENSDRLLTFKADSIIRNLRFTPDRETFTANGSVEIMFWRDG